MVKINEIPEDEAEVEHSKVTTKGKWKDLITRVKDENMSFKVDDLTRGQVAALYRSAKNAGIKVTTSYKHGYVVLSPAE